MKTFQEFPDLRNILPVHFRSFSLFFGEYKVFCNPSRTHTRSSANIPNEETNTSVIDIRKQEINHCSLVAFSPAFPAIVSEIATQSLPGRRSLKNKQNRETLGRLIEKQRAA